MTKSVPTKNLNIKNVLPWVVVALILGSLPYITAWIMIPDNLVFTGAVVNAHDASVYISAIRQGAEGSWLFNPNFSIEEWPSVFSYVPYLTIGRLARFLGRDYQFWFQLLRIMGNAGALLAFIFWVRVIFPDRRRLQLTAWFFIVFGSGLGWLVAIFSRDYHSLPDLVFPEWTTVTVFLGMPHFSLGLGFEAIVMGCIIQISRVEQGWKWAIGGSLAAVGLALSYPYITVVAGLVICLQMLHLAARDGQIPWLRWLEAGLVALPMLAVQLYYGIWGLLSPIWPYNAETSFIHTPRIPSIMIGFGLLAPFAIIGTLHWIKGRDMWLVPIWAIVNFLVLFSPITFAARFLLGFLVPVATLAAYGLEEAILPRLERSTLYDLFGRLSPTPYESLRRVFIILTIPTTLMVSLLLTQRTTMEFDSPSYNLPRTEVEAMQWLAENVEDDSNIFAYYPAGNYLPRILRSRVFLGHPFLTPNLGEKLALAETFWDANVSVNWRQNMLLEWNVSYIYAGLSEKRLSETSVTVPGDVVYDNDGVTIYRFEGTE